MNEEIYNSLRTFVIFSYDVSHGLLLLRSAKTDAMETRCDILFRDARALEMRATSVGLVISRMDATALTAFKSAPNKLVEEGLSAYRVGNEHWSGFVLAGTVSIAEDTLDFFERSPLLPS